MPDFAGSKTQRINKYAGLRAPQTPAPGLQPGMHRKTTFCFSASTCRQDGHARHPRQPANSFPVTAGQRLSDLILYRALHFPVITTSLPATAGQQPFAAYLFIPAQTTSRQLATSFRLDRPVYFRSHSFYFFFFFHSTLYKKGNRQSRFPSLFLAIPNLVQI